MPDAPLLCCTVLAALFGGLASASAAPDLVVSGVGVEGGSAVEVEPLRLVATVTNRGDVPTSADTTVAVTFIDTTGGKRRVLTYSSTFKGPLGPGESKQVVANDVWVPLAGTYPLAADVDDVDRISESNESNNTTSLELTVQPDAQVRQAMRGGRAPEPPPASDLELVPNGSFDARSGDRVAGWGDKPFAELDGTNTLLLRKSEVLEFDGRGKVIWDGEYLLRFDVKTIKVESPKDPNAGMRAVLWARGPEMHESPPGGTVSTPGWNGTADWRRIERRIRLPRGVTRFVLFLDVVGGVGGIAYVDNLSLRPVTDRPLPVDSGVAFGSGDDEQMTWVWTTPEFAWSGGEVGNTTTVAVGGHMGRSMNEPTPPAKASFSRTIAIPADARDVQVVFVGDDRATLYVNDEAVGSNQMWQQIVRVPLDGKVRPGGNEFRFDVSNAFGLAGLLGRIEWRDRAGTLQFVPTNRSWTLTGGSGGDQPAPQVALPVPAPSSFASWIYPHLPNPTYRLSYTLPEGVTNARLRAVATNGYRVSADATEVAAVESIGQPVGVDLGAALNDARDVHVTFEEVGHQPPAGNGVLELEIGGQVRLVPLSEFRTADGGSPQRVEVMWPSLTWPITQGDFEAAATLPLTDDRGETEPWVEQLLTGGQELWTIGRDDGSSAEFAALSKSAAPVAATTNPGALSRGLEMQTAPELTVTFRLDEVPASGAAFVLDVEDADALVTQCAVFVNGVLTGMPQVLGYDQVPGGRLTNRQWIVTVPPERLQPGGNQLTLRLVPSFYAKGAEAIQNQSEEYIRQLALGDRKDNPYPTPQWLHWDCLRLVALAKPPSSAVNGRPVWMGVNSAGYFAKDPKEWNEWILRDLAYLGLAGSEGPLRVGGFIKRDLSQLNRTDPSLPAGTSQGDWKLQAATDLGFKPYLLFEPGRWLRSPDQVAESHEAQVARRYGRAAPLFEIGNEVDHPNYGFDVVPMAAAYATIQKEAVVGHMLAEMVEGSAELMGQGWYHAWNFSLIDGQARKASPADLAHTQALSAHSYGTSYIIPAVTYRLLYGPGLGHKPIYITECGAWTNKDDMIEGFDINLRGNLAFATHLVQYVAHPYNPPRRAFSMFSAEGPDANVLEKARCYRRLMHAYAQHGRPLAWRPTDAASMNNRLVMVRAVDTGRFWKIALINFDQQPNRIAAEVELPAAGQFEAQRFGDGGTVAAGTRKVVLDADRLLRLDEMLAPGETVEYLIERPQ